MLTAEDGGAALAMLEETEPGVLVVDLTMPGMDGWALIKALRESEMFRHVPVAVTTSRNGVVDRCLRAQGAHIDRYLTKPLDAAELRATVRRLLLAT